MANIRALNSCFYCVLCSEGVMKVLTNAWYFESLSNQALNGIEKIFGEKLPILQVVSQMCYNDQNKKGLHCCNPLIFNVGPLGLEPRTPWLWVRCSNQLSYRPGWISHRGCKNKNKNRISIRYFAYFIKEILNYSGLGDSFRLNMPFCNSMLPSAKKIP